jgi:hypothetical protein
MAYDAARQRVVLFAGQGYGNPANDLWEWDGNEWSYPTRSPNPPPPRGAHALAYDVVRQCVVLFGGNVMMLGQSNDTWEYGYTATVTASGVPRLGGTVRLDLSAPGDAGRSYQAGSSFGTGPIWFGTRALGLSFDGLFLISVIDLWPSVFQGYRGVFGPAEHAAATVQIPTLPALVGVSIQSAFLTLDSAAPQSVQSVSNAASFTITR